MLGPLLFNVFVNGPEEVTEGMFAKFAGNTKLGEKTNRPAGRAAIHRDLERPKEWARGNLMKFIKDNLQVLPPGQEALVQEHRLEPVANSTLGYIH